MVMNAIQTRKSVRKYSEKPISENDLQKILEAGRLAPSWVNVQPWKFIVVRDTATKEVLTEAAGGQNQVRTAQAVICCVADLNDWKKTRFGKVLAEKGLDETAIDSIVNSRLLNPKNLGEQLLLLRSIEQITYAVAYMTLEAQELGIGACIVGAFANELTQCNDEMALKIKETLGLNEKQVLVSLLTLGYEENPSNTTSKRKNAEDVIFYEKIS